MAKKDGNGGIVVSPQPAWQVIVTWNPDGGQFGLQTNITDPWRVLGLLQGALYHQMKKLFGDDNPSAVLGVQHMPKIDILK